MIKKILLAFVALIAGLLGFVALQPADFTVSTTATIPAPPAVVFDHVNTLSKWEAWSPWAKLDPNATKTYDGPAAGTGAASSWSGNDEMGAGTMTITDSKPTEHIAMRLDFTRPMAATNTTAFDFKPADGGTAVTWSMSGTNGFIGKVFFLLLGVEKQLKSQFDEGLANLANAVKAAPAP